MTCSSRSRTKALILVLAGFIATAGQARAQDSQYWNIPYGPLGQLLGNQMVGSARDLSSTFYDPAGLALAQNPDFLLSVQAFNVLTVKSKPVGGGELLDASTTSFDTFPGFGAVAFPDSWFGDKTRMGFSILTRQLLDFSIDQRFTGSDERGTYGLETLVQQHMSETWGGLTVSRRLSPSLAVGGTLYGVYRSQETRWEQNLQIVRSSFDGISALSVDQFSFSHWGLLGKLGVAWEGETLRLGATVTTPRLKVLGSGEGGVTRSVTGVDLDNDGDPDAFLVNGSEEGLSSDYNSPWSIAGGAAWRRGNLQLHVSAEWFAPVGRFTILEGPGDVNLPEGPVQLNQTWDGIINAGLGVEYWLGGVSVADGEERGSTALYAAFSTDFSAANEALRDEVAVTDQDWYHISAGSAFTVLSNRFSLGVEYAFASNRRRVNEAGLPDSVPVIGDIRTVDLSVKRAVFMLGYTFGSNH